MSEALEKAKAALEQRIGQRSEPSDWFRITQERINQFAEATLDHQWIHVDPERAKNGPFGTTIAHGQLTMSIMSFLPGGRGIGLPPLEGLKLGINYGWNKVRFPAPVPVNAEVRSSGVLKSVEIKGNMLEVVNELTLEIKGQDKPGCVAESVLRLVF
ncbi:MAG TPA: MaoC family dehydratase [Pseudomonadales bacterium]